jgi:hypothetical protein
MRGEAAHRAGKKKPTSPGAGGVLKVGTSWSSLSSRSSRASMTPRNAAPWALFVPVTARRALRAGPDHPDILANAGFVLGLFGEDIDVAMRLVARSLALNPSFARGWQLSGILRNFAGEPDLAIEHFKTSLRLSPRDRLGVPGTSLRSRQCGPERRVARRDQPFGCPRASGRARP